MKIGIFSGSFNPIHMGHIMLASYFVEYTTFDEVWILVSPHNPLRKRTSKNNDNHRCAMVQMAIRGMTQIQFSDIEFTLPQPSYTINTLDALQAAYPQHDFTLIIGADNWLLFNQWYQSQRIINDYHVCIYPRRGYDIDSNTLPTRVSYIEAPMIEISSTWIREGIAEGRNMSVFLPNGVYQYIQEHQLYKTI
ncbi:MAG: nicotinate-nucleotide adenylyltransferase [Bacteroidaceae bacterium]|nr:nicotinate-nucleotide adenylyltransferase [Bacteroidaceae bacterium]